MSKRPLKPAAPSDSAIIRFPKWEKDPFNVDLPAPKPETDDFIAAAEAARAKLAARKEAYNKPLLPPGILPPGTTKPEKKTTFLTPFLEIMDGPFLSPPMRKAAVILALWEPTGWREASVSERHQASKNYLKRNQVPPTLDADTWLGLAVAAWNECVAAHSVQHINILRRARNDLVNASSRPFNATDISAFINHVAEGKTAPKGSHPCEGAYTLFDWLARRLVRYPHIDHQETRLFVLKQLVRLAGKECLPKARKSASARPDRPAAKIGAKMSPGPAQK